MEELIYESKSLNFICQAINTGLVYFDDPEQLRIVSKNKPNFIIKVVDSDLPKNTCFNVTKYFTEACKINIEEIETNFYEYIVFGIESEDSKNKLVNIPLFELLLESANHKNNESENNQESNWNLGTNEWDLYLKDNQT